MGISDFRDRLIILPLPTRIYDPQIRLFRFGPPVEVAAYELALLPLALEDFDADLGRLTGDYVIDKANLYVMLLPSTFLSASLGTLRRKPSTIFVTKDVLNSLEMPQDFELSTALVRAMSGSVLVKSTFLTELFMTSAAVSFRISPRMPAEGGSKS